MGANFRFAKNAMSGKEPTLSVLMSVYNAEAFLEKSILSIVDQSCPDFEFLIVNDGSTDATEEILMEFKKRDNRIAIIENDKNRGLAYSLNRLIDQARGKFFVRQDADDISHRHRFIRQLNFLMGHPKISLIGTWLKKIDPRDKIIGHWKPIDDPALIYFSLFHAPELAHPTVMFRREVFSNHLRYNERLFCGQDVELWQSLASRVSMSNIPDFLYYRRVHSDMVSFREKSLQQTTALRRLAHFSQEKLGLDLTETRLKNLRKWLTASPNTGEENRQAKEDYWLQWERFQNLYYGERGVPKSTFLKWKMVQWKLCVKRWLYPKGRNEIVHDHDN
jgi:glycosyltransferase involved in cell wall biosynthesis